MKHASLLAFAALFAASSASAQFTVGTSYGSDGFDKVYDALNGATILATVSNGIPEYVYVDWEQGDTKVRVYLTGSGANWSGVLPPTHAGSFYATTYAVDADGNVTPGFPTASGEAITENTTDARGLTNLRYPNINGWATLTAGTGNLDDNWYGAHTVRDSAVPQMIRLQGDTSPTVTPAYQGGSAGCVRTRSKLQDGVGSVWFKAKMASESASEGKLILDKITSTGSGTKTRYFYFPIAEITVPKATGVYEWHQFHLIIQDYPSIASERAYYRIRNNTEAASASETDLNDVAIDISDIVLTPVIPDVKIYKDELDYAPGFPSILDPIEFHIAVSNVFPSAPAANFTPRLHWRQGTRADWNETPMTNVVHFTEQGDGTYACVLTPEGNGLSDGPFEYFYTVDHTGYTPTFPAIKDNRNDAFNLIVNDRFDWNQYSYLIHTNAWALLTDANGNISENRSPAACPTFWDTFEKTGAGAFYHYSRSYDVAPDTPAENGDWDFTRKFDLFHLDEGWPVGTLYYMVRESSDNAKAKESSLQIAGTYEYNTFLAKDGVRRFRSMFTDLAAVTADHPDAEKPSFLDRAYPMQHVGDYTWQAIMHVTNAVDAYFSVTGAFQSLRGATSYESGPFEWVELDQNQTNINPPMSGQEEDGSQLRIYPMTKFEHEETITGRYTNTIWGVTMTPGIWVGVVTNAVETNELGQALVPPTADDVAYWYEKITYGEPDDQGNVVTNHDLQIYNYTLNVVDPDHPERNTVTTNAYNTFYDYIFADNPWLVTNECSVGTAVTKTLVPGDEWSRVVTVSEWRLNEDHPDFDGHTLRTRVQIDYDGFLMYRFCTTNGSYQIRRAAWQDFNAWQADDNEYSRSFGLYDMKTFESDLEGRDLTVFKQSLDSVLIDSVKAMDNYSPASGQYMYGYIGKNAKVLKDRVLSDNAPDWTSKTKNTEVVLRGYPGIEGSLETTSENKGEGRGTLKMRVRSHTDDDRNAVYRGDENSATGVFSATGWENYRVMARIMAPNTDDVSDAEHSLSLIGYWRDPNNYWEARITQKSELMADQKGRTRNWFEVHVYAWIDGEPHEQYGYIQGNGNGWSYNHNYQASNAKRPTWPGWNNTGNTGDRNDAGLWNKGNDADYGLFTLNRTSGSGANLRNVRWCFVFDLKTDGTKVTPMVWAFRSHDVEDKRCNNLTMAKALANQQSGSYYLYKLAAIECSSGTFAGATTKGAPGFNMRDCGLKVAPYIYDVDEAVSFDGSSASAKKAVSTDPATSWYLSDDALYDRTHKVKVWSVTKGSITKTDPTVLTRPAPNVWYGVRTFRTDEEQFPDGAFVAPVPFYQNGVTRDWDDDWDAYNGHTSDKDTCVAKYRWQDVSFDMDLWDQTYISVQALSGSLSEGNNPTNRPSSGNLAVDSITCNDWRGVTVWDEEYADTNIAATVSFGSTYAAIVPSGRTGRRYELNRSRANPNRVQAITTPQLLHGVGDLLFTYEVAKHPVEVAVQLGDSTQSEWSDLDCKLLPVGSEGSIYVPCLSNKAGRLRIVARTPDGAEAGALGTLYVDNVRATDYPNVGDTSWEVYNALVSTFPETVSQRTSPSLTPLQLRLLKFDGATDAAATYRSAVLNDGPANQTLQGHVFNEHVPFVQTPSIETGVGEVSFWYRASPDNNGSPAKLELQVATVGTTPDSEWRPLTEDDLYWNDKLYTTADDDPEYVRQRDALNALTNIVVKPGKENDWTYFNVEFYEKDYRMLRLVVGETNNCNRVMLDNVLITEPVRASVDVGSIEFLPQIPLCTGSTDAKVTLVNPRMHPENIRVYLDWYVQKSPVVDIVSTNENITVITNWSEPIEVPLPNGYVATYQTNWVEIISRPMYDVTRVPENLRWGYESWSNRWDEAPGAGGSIALTNDQATAPYVFYTTEPIPTDKYPADTIFQYCVRVEYDGRFNSPVFSELQGRVKNGFWFENPSWYEPIDLNKTFDTRERPVAHFWNFSCTTNVVFFNEILPVYGSLPALKNQFIELIGPRGASIEKWRIEHFGFEDFDAGILDPDWVVFTNIVTSPKAGEEAVFQASRTSNTNKGWGFWVLGCHGIDDNGEKLSNQKLFPDSWVDVDGINDNGIYDVPWFMGVPGALRLRRSMGAYVDAVAWGQEYLLTDFKRRGFKYLRDTYYDYYPLAWQGYISTSWEGDVTKELVWNLAWNPTIGSYNENQEDVLPFLDGTVEEEEEIPGIDRPVILSFEFVDAGTVRIVAAVRMDEESAAKGLELRPDHYHWYFEGASELESFDQSAPGTVTDLYPVDVAEFEPVDDGPLAGGGWKKFSGDVTVVVGEGAAPAMFYRVYATPRAPVAP